MLYRSKAPLRIGFAGGGTDVSPYCNIFGGAILNAAISLYARSSIQLINEPSIIIEATGCEAEIHPLSAPIPINGSFSFAKGVINRIDKDFGLPQQGFRLFSSVDVPIGSGLGTSSTLVVSMLGAFTEYMKLPLGEYDMARYAYEIERNDLGFAGGRQDQYAATFGGINFMEFLEDNTVIVNPLRIRPDYLYEMENNLVLYYTSVSRQSATIIKEQQRNVTAQDETSVTAMHHLKEQAILMKEALLKGNLDEIGAILDYGFREKRKMAANISNPFIEEIYEAAKKAGASGGKISGAGGGGFMFFYCPGNTRYAVEAALATFGGQVFRFSFAQHGQISWAI